MSEERGQGSSCLFPFGGDFLPLFGLLILDEEERRRRAAIEEEEGGEDQEDV